MIPSSASSSAAVLLLRQSMTLQTNNAKPAAPDLIEIASGKASSHAGGTTGKDFFSATTLDVTEMKTRLMERLGKAFGISFEDYSSPRNFGSAVRKIIDDMRTEPGGATKLAEIEKELGLDDLRISIDTLVGAIIDPAGSDGDKLDAALKAYTGDLLSEEDTAKLVDRLARMGLDEAGLYGP